MAMPSDIDPPGLLRCSTISSVSIAAIVWQSSFAVSEGSNQSSPITS